MHLQRRPIRILSRLQTHARAFTNTFRSDLQADWNPPPSRAISVFQFRENTASRFPTGVQKQPPPLKNTLDPGPYPPRPKAPSPSKGLEEGAPEDFWPPIQPPTRFPAPDLRFPPPSIPQYRLLFTASDLRLSRCSVRPKWSERNGGHRKRGKEAGLSEPLEKRETRGGGGGRRLVPLLQRGGFYPLPSSGREQGVAAREDGDGAKGGSERRKEGRKDKRGRGR